MSVDIRMLNKDTMALGCTFFMIYIKLPLDSALRKAHYFMAIIPPDLWHSPTTRNTVLCSSFTRLWGKVRHSWSSPKEIRCSKRVKQWCSLCNFPYFSLSPVKWGLCGQFWAVGYEQNQHVLLLVQGSWKKMWVFYAPLSLCLMKMKSTKVSKLLREK